jgi:hypothetical protein
MTESELRQRLHAAFDAPLPTATQLRVQLTLQQSRSRFRERALATAGALAAVLVVSAIVAVMLGAAGLRTHGAPATTSSPRPTATLYMRSHVVTLEEAKADSPDPILLPTWLPFPSISPRLQQIDAPEGRSSVTIIDYPARSGHGDLLITELHSTVTDFRPAGRTEAGTVGGQPALFSQFGSDGEPAAVAWMLPNGHYVTIQASGLTKSELVKVAESLRPDPPANPNCPGEVPLSTGPGDKAAAEATAVDAVPRLYASKRLEGWRVARVYLAQRDSGVGQIAYGMCGDVIGQRTWVVEMTFPAELPSASMSQGQFFVSRFSDGWRVWFQYH